MHVWLVVPNSLQPHSTPGSSVHGIFQARVLEWVAVSYSGYLPNPGMEPVFPAPPALVGRLFIPMLPEKSHMSHRERHTRHMGKKKKCIKKIGLNYTYPRTHKCTAK